MSVFKVVGICGSLRKASTNMGLLRWVSAHAPAGVEIQIADISDIPLYNADIDTDDKPTGVCRLAKLIGQADALLLACPEYNYSMAPALKNALDWMSRMPDTTLLSGKPVAIMGAGGGMGTSRAQYHLRQTCVYLNLLPLNKPEVFSNAFAGGFDAEGNLTDPDVQAAITQLLSGLQACLNKTSSCRVS